MDIDFIANCNAHAKMQLPKTLNETSYGHVYRLFISVIIIIYRSTIERYQEEEVNKKERTEISIILFRYSYLLFIRSFIHNILPMSMTCVLYDTLPEHGDIIYELAPICTSQS